MNERGKHTSLFRYDRNALKLIFLVVEHMQNNLVYLYLAKLFNQV